MTRFIENLFISLFAVLLTHVVGVWWISLIIAIAASFVIYWCSEKL